MNEMIELVARAIREPLFRNFPDIEYLSSNITEREIAQAAIAAMREPTGPMIKAYIRAEDQWKNRSVPPITAWQAMIDEALK